MLRTSIALLFLFTFCFSLKEKSIQFSGRLWNIKAGYRLAGPNFWETSNPFVDEDGRLHLRIRELDGNWTTSEIYTKGTFGYGTYTWTVITDVTNLDPNVVLGLFTWDDAKEYAHRELDIEIAKWGGTAPNGANAQFALQPHYLPGHKKFFNHTKSHGKQVFSFTWTKNSIKFFSPSFKWTYQGKGKDAPPPPGNETVRINLWLNQGKKPSEPVEVVVERFDFKPVGS